MNDKKIVEVPVRCTLEEQAIGHFALDEGAGVVTLDWNVFLGSFIPVDQEHTIRGTQLRGSYALCPKCGGRLEVIGTSFRGEPSGVKGKRTITRSQARLDAERAAESAASSDRRRLLPKNDRRGGGAQLHMENRSSEETSALIVVGSTRLEV
jgi:hypothetical protein